jgi:hypothetical protein
MRTSPRLRPGLTFAALAVRQTKCSYVRLSAHTQLLRLAPDGIHHIKYPVLAMASPPAHSSQYHATTAAILPSGTPLRPPFYPIYRDHGRHCTQYYATTVAILPNITPLRPPHHTLITRGCGRGSGDAAPATPRRVLGA